MKEHEGCSVSDRDHVYPMFNFFKQRKRRGDNRLEKTRDSQADLSDTDRESSDILKIYLQHLRDCARKKRRRCVSRELG